MPFGPVQTGLAERMGGGGMPAPPQAGPPPGPGGQMAGPPGMGGGDPIQRLAEALGEARMAIGEMGPQGFAQAGKELLRGFIGSVTALQSQMGGGVPPQAGPPGIPGAPPPQPGPPPAPPGFPVGP